MHLRVSRLIQDQRVPDQENTNQIRNDIEGAKMRQNCYNKIPFLTE